MPQNHYFFLSPSLLYFFNGLFYFSHPLHLLYLSYPSHLLHLIDIFHIVLSHFWYQKLQYYGIDVFESLEF